jgi:hypothetical protein
LGPRKNAASEEIRTIKKNLRTLYWRNRKDTSVHLRKWLDTTHQWYKDFKKPKFEKRTLEHPTGTGLPREVFHYV